MMEMIRKFDKNTWINLKDLQYLQSPHFQIPEAWSKIFYKTYPRFKQIKLNNSNKKGELEEILLKRESKREFTQKPISFDDLSYILQFSVGKKSSDRRMYPSGGARYPIELYAFIYNVEDLISGTYHYNIKDNTLEQLKTEKALYEEFFGTNIKDSAVVLLMTGVLARLEVKYLENAYKFSLIESGHIAQNISLLSEKLDIGSCCIGGFDNKKIIEHLDLVQEEEIPLYAIALGLPSKEVNKKYKNK